MSASISSIVLKLFIAKENSELCELYKTHIQKHNASQMTDPFPNAGFDIFFPEDQIFESKVASTFVNFQIKCEMIQTQVPQAFYVYPRSSISKTPLLLANNVAIIDSGYRGNIIGAFRNLGDESWSVKKHERLLQICHSSLGPIRVEIVENEEDLSTTARGEGGFGSTGK